MKKITASSIPIKEVIEGIAKQLGEKVQVNCNFYALEIPKKFGSGQIRGIDFGGGFGMLNYNCKFKEDVEIHFTYDQVHPMKFLHCYKGKLIHRFENEEEEHHLATYGNIIVASAASNGHILKFAAGKRARICSIEIDRKEFYPKYQCEFDSEKTDIQNVIEDHSAKNRFYYIGNYSIAISNIIQSILEPKENIFVEVIYSEGKSYEMLALQWDQYQDDQTGNQNVHRQIQFKKFDKMARYVDKNLTNDLSLEKLSQKFLTNAKDLQTVFKLFGNNTVNNYIQEVRLKKAVELIETSNKNISEIVYSVGLVNRSYFSKIFYNKYGLKPSEYRKQFYASKSSK